MGACFQYCLTILFQTYIHFNPEDPSQIVTNSESQVIFYQWVCSPCYKTLFMFQRKNNNIKKDRNRVFMFTTSNSYLTSSWFAIMPSLNMKIALLD